MASVKLHGVRKVFPNGFEAIRGVDLEIEDGEFMVLVGPSGCGKSTLLRLIAGLEAVTDGTVVIGERDVTDEPPARRDIAMVFQSYALYPHMRVVDNLAFGLRGRRTPAQIIADRVGRVSSALGLRELLDRRPGMLSGGQRQRVAIGRAMVRQPVVYLMDEPLSNLDAKLRVAMRAELARLHERLGVTTVYVTHDQVEAMTLGSRVCVMLDGTIQQVDTPTRLFHSPANTFVAATIGSPSMNLAVGHLDDGVLTVGAWRVMLPADVHADLAGRSTVIVGVRPTDFRLRSADFVADDAAAPPAVTSVRVRVETVEQLGAEQMVVFPVEVSRYTPPGSHPVTTLVSASPADDETLLAEPERTWFTARLDARRPVHREQELELWFDAQLLYLFDVDTGLALSVRDHDGAHR